MTTSAQAAASAHGHAFEARRFRLGAGGRVLPQGDDDVLHAAVAQVHGMGVALAAVADDGDLLGLDQIDVRRHSPPVVFSGWN
jgi:hypothetical protein